MNIPIVMLDNDLHVRRFTPMAGKVLNLRPADIDRPLTEINNQSWRVPDFKLLSGVVEDLSTKESGTCRISNGAWYSLRVRPYRTEDHKIVGAVMVLYDVDLAQAESGRGRAAREIFPRRSFRPLPGRWSFLDSHISAS